MTFLAVLPNIWEPYTKDCLHGMSPALRDETMVVDNTVTNRGVAASWNLGARQVIAEQRDWLISVSAATRFGPHGGTDFLAALTDEHDALVVESSAPVGWHLIAWSRERLLEPIGLFDENCWPAYGEDADMSWRVLTVTGGAGKIERDGVWYELWPKVDVDAWLAMQNHGCQLAGVQVDHEVNEGYLRSKWGARVTGGGYQFTRPFGNASLPLSYWPTPAEPGHVPHPGWTM